MDYAPWHGRRSRARPVGPLPRARIRSKTARWAAADNTAGTARARPLQRQITTESWCMRPALVLRFRRQTAAK